MTPHPSGREEESKGEEENEQSKDHIGNVTDKVLAPKNPFIRKVRQFKKKYDLDKRDCKMLYLFSDFVHEETVLSLQSQITALQQTIEEKDKRISELEASASHFFHTREDLKEQLASLSNGRKQVAEQAFKAGESFGMDYVMSTERAEETTTPDLATYLSQFDVNDKTCT